MIMFKHPGHGPGGWLRRRAEESGASPGEHRRRRRWVGVFSLTTAVTVCALTACALFAPVTVFGAQAPDAASNATVATAAYNAVAEATASYGAGLNLSQGTLLTVLPWGNGAGEVGVARPTEGLTRGPEALAVAPDGRMAVLDSVNQRVLFLDSNGRQTGSAPLALAEPRFLAVTNSCVYVLDCDATRGVQKLDWDGTSLGSLVLPTLPDVVTGLFATSSGPCVEIAHDHVYLLTAGSSQGNNSSSWSLATLTGEPGRPLDQSFTRFADMALSSVAQPEVASFVSASGSTASKVTDLDMALPIGQAVDSLVSVDGAAGDELVVGARLSEIETPQQYALVLLRLFRVGNDGSIAPAPGGESFALVDWSNAYVGQPYVIAPDGRVFQPVATDSGYAIFVHSFGTGMATAQTEGV